MWGPSTARAGTPPARKVARNGMWVDAVTSRHVASDVEGLLQSRTLMHRQEYGWCYDAWPMQPSEYALAGANGRFSLQAVGSQLKQVICAGVHVMKIELRTAQTALSQQGTFAGSARH
mmetsp:Transcript_10522/g.31605  ORF Transcript_10522/g.31605 Transcript_10522/m.31605 type:complete len:118 (-) Transcript_10522:493-846(-)